MSPHRQVPCPCPSVCGSIRTLGLFIFSAAEPHAQPKPTALPPCRLADSSVRSAIVADTSTARRRVSRPHSSALNSARPVERCDWLFLLEEGPRLPEPGAGRSEPGAGRSSSAVWMPSPPLTAPEGTPPPPPRHTPRVLLSSGRRPRPGRPPEARPARLPFCSAQRLGQAEEAADPWTGTRRPAFSPASWSASPETVSQVTSHLWASGSCRINCR